jgi:spore maturation protein CgeB
MKNNDIADVYFGEREPEGMADFEEVVGEKYHVLPNAANKKLHYPAKSTAKYQYDIVYLGSKLPMKKWFFDKVLIPLTKRYNVAIFGPNWTVKDNILRTGVKIFRTLNLRQGVDLLNKYRVLIPADEENLLYSSAKISLNFHEREPDGSQPHYILNQRTFKIPACGGFQICDEVSAIRKYFNEDELVTAAYDSKDWFDKIEYYLSHDNERKKIQKRGSKRALKDHTYHNRVDQIIELYRGIQCPL